MICKIRVHFLLKRLTLSKIVKKIWVIKLHPKAVKDFNKIQKKDIAALVVAISDFKIEAMPGNAIKLRNSPYCRYRVGDYRIIYEVNTKGGFIEILRILKRDDQTYNQI